MKCSVCVRKEWGLNMARYREEALGLNHQLKELHWPIILLVSVLCLFGVAMLFSAARGEMDPWASRHLTRFLFMLPVMALIALVDIQFWVRTSYWIYAAGVLMLIIVEMIGIFGKGAQRWVSVGGTNFQPSEFMKVALVLALARYYHFVYVTEVNRPIVLAVPLAMIVVPAVLILHQPNLGTATIVCLTGVSVMFFARACVALYHHCWGCRFERATCHLEPNA